jgi:hypothetical protein
MSLTKKMAMLNPIDRAIEAIHASHETSRKHDIDDTIATLVQLKTWQSELSQQSLSSGDVA